MKRIASSASGDVGDVYIIHIHNKTVFYAIPSDFLRLFQRFFVILDDSYNLLTHRRLGRMEEFRVTNWQPCLFLRFALSCLTWSLVSGQR